MWFFFIIIIIGVVVYFYFKSKKSNLKLEKNGGFIPTVSMKKYVEVREPPIRKTPKVLANDDYCRDDLIESFIDEWTDPETYNDDNNFKKKPTKNQAIDVFNQLAEQNHLYFHIDNNTDEIVITKFRELYPDVANSHEEREKLFALEDFIEDWMDADLEENEFKRKPSKKACITVFEELNNSKINYEKIRSNEDNLVIDKFRELFPEITHTALEKEILDEREYFIDDWTVWDGSVGEYKSKLVKKPTKKQVKEVFNALIVDGHKPIDIAYDDKAVFKKLIFMFPELKKD